MFVFRTLYLYRDLEGWRGQMASIWDAFKQTSPKALRWRRKITRSPRRGQFFRFLQISAFEETFHKGEQPLSQNNLKQMNRKWRKSKEISRDLSSSYMIKPLQCIGNLNISPWPLFFEAYFLTQLSEAKCCTAERSCKKKTEEVVAVKVAYWGSRRSCFGTMPARTNRRHSNAGERPR